jgi:amino acid permease
VLLLAAALTPVILKKELAELEWLSFVLFGAIGLFVFINLYQLELAPQFNYIQQGFNSTMWTPFPSPIRFISAVSITLVAYSYQFNLYPVYGSLQVKTNQQYMKTNNYGLSLTLLIYTTVALISIGMFGDNLQSVVLVNIGTAKTQSGGTFWESYVTQVSFMVLLSCHIPFIFFAGKEGLLIIIDELDRKSISSALWHKLYATNETFEKQNTEGLPPNPLLPIPGMTTPFLSVDD